MLNRLWMSHSHRAKVIWTQLGIINDTAAKKARQAGLQVIQNRCISVEHQRLFL